MSDSVTKCGVLTKRGAIIKNWKQRYFVLKGTKLSYYRTTSPTKAKADTLADTIFLKVAKVEAGTEHDLIRFNCQAKFSASQLIVLSIPGRDHVFVAQTQTMRDEWLEAIQSAQGQRNTTASTAQKAKVSFSENVDKMVANIKTRMNTLAATHNSYDPEVAANPFLQLEMNWRFFAKDPEIAANPLGLGLYFFSRYRTRREMKLSTKRKQFTKLNFTNSETSSPQRSPNADEESEEEEDPTAVVFGVSAAFLIDFCEQKLQLRDVAQSEEYQTGVLSGNASYCAWSVRDVIEKVIKPETVGKNCAYVDLLKDVYDPLTYDQLAEPATVIVSLPEESDFLSAVNTMLAFAETCPDSFFHVDLFCKRQNHPRKTTLDWWSNVYPTNIRAIGTMLVIVSPWTDPLALQCPKSLWEIKCAHKLKRSEGTGLIFGMPPSQALQCAAVVADAKVKKDDALAPRFNAVDSATAEGSITHSNVQRLREAIQADGGFAKLDTLVKKEIKTWFKGMVKQLAK